MASITRLYPCNYGLRCRNRLTTCRYYHSEDEKNQPIKQVKTRVCTNSKCWSGVSSNTTYKGVASNCTFAHTLDEFFPMQCRNYHCCGLLAGCFFLHSRDINEKKRIFDYQINMLKLESKEVRKFTVCTKINCWKGSVDEIKASKKDCTFAHTLSEFDPYNCRVKNCKGLITRCCCLHTSDSVILNTIPTRSAVEGKKENVFKYFMDLIQDDIKNNTNTRLVVKKTLVCNDYDCWKKFVADCDNECKFAHTFEEFNPQICNKSGACEDHHDPLSCMKIKDKLDRSDKLTIYKFSLSPFFIIENGKIGKLMNIKEITEFNNQYSRELTRKCIDETSRIGSLMEIEDLTESVNLVSI